MSDLISSNRVPLLSFLGMSATYLTLRFKGGRNGHRKQQQDHFLMSIDLSFTTFQTVGSAPRKMPLQSNLFFFWDQSSPTILILDSSTFFVRFEKEPLIFYIISLLPKSYKLVTQLWKENKIQSTHKKKTQILLFQPLLSSIWV